MENMSNAQLRKMCVKMTDIELKNSAKGVAKVYKVCKEVLQERGALPMREPMREPMEKPMVEIEELPLSPKELMGRKASPRRMRTSMSSRMLPAPKMETPLSPRLSRRRPLALPSRSFSSIEPMDGYNDGKKYSSLSRRHMQESMDRPMNLNGDRSPRRKATGYDGYHHGYKSPRYRNRYNGYNRYNDNKVGKTLIAAGGGALIGGAVAGPIGAVGGGLLGAGIGKSLNN